MLLARKQNAVKKPMIQKLTYTAVIRRIRIYNKSIRAYAAA